MRRLRLLLAATMALVPLFALVSDAPATAAFAAGGPTCPSISAAQAFARADVVFDGVAQIGAVTTTGYLSTPTKFKVVRYLKGTGPAVVTTAGGPRTGGGIGFISLESAGLLVKAGESWVVYGKGDPSGVVETSVCYGTHQTSRTGASRPRPRRRRG